MTFDTKTTERSLNSTKKEMEAEESARRKADLQTTIDLIMHSPLKKGEVIRLTAENPIPLKDLKGANVEMQTAMILSMASGAVSGDVKKAEFLCKYGGYEPVKEAKVAVESVTFIDDIPRPALEPVVTAITESLKEDDA